MAKYTNEFKQEVVNYVNEYGYDAARVKYQDIVYPDTIKNWCDPKRLEKAKQKQAEYYNKNKDREEFKEKQRKLSEEWRNSEKGKEYGTQYRKDNFEKLSVTAKAHREAHLEEYLENQRQWYRENKERVSIWQRQYDSEHKEHYKKLLREKYNSDPITKLKSNIRAGINRGIKGSEVAKQHSSSVYLGCTIEKLKVWLEERFLEGMTWDNHGETNNGAEGWHIDHITPLSAFDLNTEEARLQAFHYTNLQPLWKSDNLSKRDKLTEL